MSQPSTSNTSLLLGIAGIVTCIVGVTLALRRESQEKFKWQKEAEERQKELTEVKEQYKKQVGLRLIERTSRISSQRLARENIRKSQSEGGITYHPIGHIESPFPDRRGTPRQPQLVPAANGYLNFSKHIQTAHYEELNQFSHVWIIFVFHDNTNTEKERLRESPAKIKPPRLHGEKVGCLSTRTPHRPNNIGLSVCEIVSVDTKNHRIILKGIDMCNGTPILDIKPYIPYDIIDSDYTLQMAKSASGDSLQTKKLQVPNWIVDADIPMLSVTFNRSTIKSIEKIANRKELQFCESCKEYIELATQVLRQDIRGVHQGRGKTSSKKSDSDCNDTNDNGVKSKLDLPYECRLDSILLHFTTNEFGIEVINAEKVKDSILKYSPKKKGNRRLSAMF